jgi:ribosomal protein S18 acetylase RimI-like enzyme
MIVRDGVETDLPLVAALRVRGWDDTYREIVGDAIADQLLDVEEHLRAMQRDLGTREAFLLVAEAPSSEVVGFALNRLDDAGRPFLESLHVRSGDRRSGTGTDLLRATALRWMAAGFEHMSLHVLAANTAARRLYERLGAVEIGTLTTNWKGTSVPTVLCSWPSLTRLSSANWDGSRRDVRDS